MACAHPEKVAGIRIRTFSDYLLRRKLLIASRLTTDGSPMMRDRYKLWPYLGIEKDIRGTAV